MKKNSASGLRLANAIALLMVVATFSLARSAGARPFEFRGLDPEVVKRLPAPAAAAYEQTVTEMDHVNFEAAWQHLSEAVTLAPESIELRFLAVSFARYRGENASGIEAARNLDQAIEHAKAIEASNRASARDKRSAGNILASIDKDRKAIEVRDEARRTVGLKIAKAYGKEIYSGKGKSKEISDFESAVKQLTKPGSSSDKATKAAAKALASGQKVPLPGEPMPPAAGGVTELEPGSEIVPPPPSSEASEPMAPKAAESAAPAPSSDAAGAGANGMPPPPAAVAQELPPPPAAAAAPDAGPSGIVEQLAGDRVPFEAGSADYDAAKQFVDTTMASVLKSWNIEEIWPLLDQDFMAVFDKAMASQGASKFKMQPKQMVGMMFATSAVAVGALKEYKPATGVASNVSTASGPVTSAAFRTVVVFENETCPLYVEVVKRADGWKLRDFNVNSKLIKQEQEKMAKSFGGGKGGLMGGGKSGGAAPAAPAEPAPAAAPAEPAPAAGANPFK